MATYTAITDAEIDQDSPITQTLMQKYRDNLTATIEGDATAPKIADAWQTGTASTSAGLSIANMDSGEGAKIHIGGTSSSVSNSRTARFVVAYSTDNGSTWSSEIILRAVTAPSPVGSTATVDANGIFYFDRPTGEIAFLSDVGGLVTSTTWGSSASTATNLRFRYTDNNNPLSGGISAISIITGGKGSL